MLINVSVAFSHVHECLCAFISFSYMFVLIVWIFPMFMNECFVSEFFSYVHVCLVLNMSSSVIYYFTWCHQLHTFSRMSNHTDVSCYFNLCLYVYLYNLKSLCLYISLPIVVILFMF